MTPFDRHTGIAAPLLRANVNTDLITPARFLCRSRADGFADTLFADLQNSKAEDGTRFILSTPPFDRASILVAGENFGCGSSREHAVWALVDYGIKVVIASSFADIFYNNAIQNGLLPVRLSERDMHRLAMVIEARPGMTLTADLGQQLITCEGLKLIFEIDPYRKEQLLRGLSEIDLTLDALDRIQAFEARRSAEVPWLMKSKQP
ncbi:3-isopropylmalate dehydratase small subunit [Roseobacter sp. HKCCD9010]|uniref:3-isopropylmalate dehydratase small subunit n=1 Tax=unclassified Roseobacter TaxID=196798 RepID=UPI0014910AD6|nr:MULTISPECIES: 3-isopropylmalate dehydratase small subunit [unclassified Roseobacter]MBF9052245.1 3-isopropylmalate dehydratase small subunit [Rhodobacterales bacterium HKCCD4356]NNV14084.1 3-isopropylmalate dehydratase small subunit [Roseobacter sp. HKCCD7357]NNV18405.1 3-isopropylmalate dehydratase small subunit [Roseobacter sp. HKCCD8768]NNV27844.1 3-isopropylmalate dehydratase small subunit [Roseobacter sp. HKCCD8192]NNV32164.1 3-isopropylmalate dehydratase small subunit [Roseobacter sp.